MRPRDDNTLERGDIIVTEERAKNLSQPTETMRKNAAEGKGAQPKSEPATTAGHVRRQARPMYPAVNVKRRCARWARRKAGQQIAALSLPERAFILVWSSMAVRNPRLRSSPAPLSLTNAPSGAGSDAPESRKRLVIG